MKCPHCEVHIDIHGPSRCLDAWVAAVVMEYTDIRECKPALAGHDTWEYCLYEGDCHEPYGINCFFSTRIAAAWIAVEKAEIISVCRAWDLDGELKGWTAWADDSSMSNAPTPMLAICRAAIKATVND